MASTVAIEELTGKKRAVVLIGAGLPRQGANWGGQLVQTTTFNPGNREGTKQILGPVLPPSTFAGFWRTTMLVVTPCKFRDEGGTLQPVSRAISLMKVVELILSSGQLLKVVWSQTTNAGIERITRVGTAESWDFQVTRADDIGWSINWAWSGFGEQPKKIDLKKDLQFQSLKKANQQLTDLQSELAAQGLLDAAGITELGPDSFDLGDLESIANIPKEFAKQLSQTCTLFTGKFAAVGKLLVNTAVAPIQFTSAMVGIATNAVTTFTQMIDEMGQVFPDAYSELDGNASALVEASEYFGTASDGADRVLGTMAEILIAAKQRQSNLVPGTGAKQQAVTQDILAIVITAALETFLSLSLRFYGTADLASQIALSNGFDESEIAPPPGTTIIIPVINPLLSQGKI